jgi:hypothetical protein
VTALGNGVIAHFIDLPRLGSVMPAHVMPMKRNSRSMFFGDDLCMKGTLNLPPQAKAARNMLINAESLPGYQI